MSVVGQEIGAASGVVIANPRAGVTAKRALAAIQSTNGPWKALRLLTTEHRGHARELAAEAAARGEEIVIACGGDGTINEVAWGLLGTEAAMGVLPAGSGNGLARTLGIPREPRAALVTLAGATIRRMDVGFVNGKPFLNVAGAGFDADVAHAFDDHGRRGGRRGLVTYFRVGLRVAWGFKASDLRVKTPAGERAQPSFLVAFFNARQYGGGAVIAPHARVDDGLIDVVSVDSMGLGELLLNGHRMYTGSLESFRRYTRVLAPEAVLEATTPVRFHRDGEPEPPTTRLEVSVRPRALRVLVPQAWAAQPGGPFGSS